MLDTLLSFLSDTLKEKKPLVYLKIALNVLLVGSISSYLFEWCFFKYELIDVDDYKAIAHFFITGHFFLPMTLFYLVWVLTQYPPALIYLALNNSISKFLKNKILYLFEKARIDIFEKVDTVERYISFRKSWFVMLYVEVKKQMPPKTIQRFQKGIARHKTILEDNFVLTVRLLLGFSVYAFQVSYIGWGSCVLIVTLIVIIWCISIALYQLTEVIPLSIGLVSSEIEITLNSKNRYRGIQTENLL